MSRTNGPVFGLRGHAYQELRGGTFEQHGRTLSAAQSASSYVLMLYGGTFAVCQNIIDTAGWGTMFNLGAGFSHLCLKGGRMEIRSGDTLNANEGAGATVVTLDGPDAVLAGPVAFSFTKDTAGSLTVNLNAGVLAGYVTRYKNQTGSFACVNFNGGTLRLTGSSGIVHNDIKATVFEGGAVLDVTAAQTDVDVPLRAPVGKGVVSVPLPEDLADETFVGAPAVRIDETGTDGKGFGASAVAVWDRATGKVTGVQVTSAGDGYTEATATIFCGASRHWTQVCTLAENVKTGGLVKKGIGQLYLKASGSDYRGETQVLAGGITLAADYALPSNGVLRIDNGGNVNLNGKAVKFASVGGSGGTLHATSKCAMELEAPLAGTSADLKLENVTPSFVGDWTISAAELLAGTATAEYDADVTFGSEATVTIDGFAALDTDAGRAGSPYVLFKVADGKTLTGMPTWTNPPADGSWTLRRSGNAVKLAYRHGLMLLVR